MDKHKNILYIGPYNEESNRGRVSLINVKALNKIGHRLKAVPIYYPGEKNKETPQDLLPLENNNLEHYDICIQHCDPMQYSFNNNIDKNIGIYTPNSVTSEPIINTRMALLDNIIVYSKKIYTQLPRILSQHILNKLRYCPKYIDLDYIINYKKELLDWTDSQRYYFYSELEFTEEYDWEKLIYVYLTSFMNKNAGLIIKTKNIADEEQASYITNKINNIAMYANIKPNKDNMPKILNGVFDEDTQMRIYNSIHCFIDCGRNYDYNNNILVAAALQKRIICNSQLSTSDFFPEMYKVNAIACTVNYSFNNDLLSSSMYEQHYSMECNSLKETMNLAYDNRYLKEKISYEQLKPYDISNINNLLC